MRLLEEYMEAKEHIFINGMRCAVLENDQLAILLQKEEGFEFRCVHKVEVLMALLKEYPYLTGAEPKKNFSAVVPKEINFLNWEEQLEEMDLENLAVVSRFYKRDIRECKIFYFSKESNGVYDVLRKEDSQLSPLEQRLCFMKFLGIETEEEEV